MNKLLSVLSCLVFLSVSCSRDAVAPVEDSGSIRQSLMGTWSGQLAALNFRPDTTSPFWQTMRDTDRTGRIEDIYLRSYAFTGLRVDISFGDSIFVASYRYESDTLQYWYEERGPWEVIGQKYPTLIATPIRIDGELYNPFGSARLNRNFCCWQSNLRLQDGDPIGPGCQALVLSLNDIQCSLEFDSLRLEK